MHNSQSSDRNADSQDCAPSPIPDIDVAGLLDTRNDQQQISAKIHAAATTPGYFFIHNTGIDATLHAQVLQMMQQFFSLSDADPLKRSIRSDSKKKIKGWSPLLHEPAYEKNTLAHVESFDFGQELTRERYRELDIEENTWPDIELFRETFLQYYSQTTELARLLSQVFADLLGLPAGWFDGHSGERAPRTMRLLHYPPFCGPANEQDVGIAPHTDFECFTIMWQNADGLELRDHNGNWQRVSAEPGRFTVILGDMLERLSNGQYPATGHRVALTPWQRYSSAFFFALDNDFSVAPLANFVSSGRPAQFAPVTQGEHIERQLRRSSAYQKSALAKRLRECDR